MLGTSGTQATRSTQHQHGSWEWRRLYIGVMKTNSYTCLSMDVSVFGGWVVRTDPTSGITRQQ